MGGELAESALLGFIREVGDDEFVQAGNVWAEFFLIEDELTLGDTQIFTKVGCEKFADPEMGEGADIVCADCFGEEGVSRNDRGIERGGELLRCSRGWWKVWRARSGSIADFF